MHDLEVVSVPRTSLIALDTVVALWASAIAFDTSCATGLAATARTLIDHVVMVGVAMSSFGMVKEARHKT